MEILIIILTTFMLIWSFLKAGSALEKRPPDIPLYFLWTALGVANLLLLVSVHRSNAVNSYKAEQQQEQLLEKEATP